ncbi:unnamed protein product [Aspergillus oryzae]|uniref:Unnamed protein product n=2 Tax=Aspergillus oryzae TaxID=5062 RepID=A0AAN4YCQ4_ASPOZ|nr:unnamed protein product [Aspergillus oryzae]GMF83779.1 unnamed protein product [Aspergillus oryzae]GMG06129.1 unnamed protein product [Aspergillus oryzae]GMG23499.1 unnamed protein product [Aspergillus oryzae]GMG42756.1 unnamed protein product [Aspergillus oryzae var. brunneus]
MGHLHLDHAGGLEHFLNTDVPIYVHEEEFKHACWGAGTKAEEGSYLYVIQPLFTLPHTPQYIDSSQAGLSPSRRIPELANLQRLAIRSVHGNNSASLPGAYARPVYHAGQLTPGWNIHLDHGSIPCAGELREESCAGVAAT